MNEARHSNISESPRTLRHILVMVLFAVAAALGLIWGPLEPIRSVGGLFNSMSVWVLMRISSGD